MDFYESLFDLNHDGQLDWVEESFLMEDINYGMHETGAYDNENDSDRSSSTFTSLYDDYDSDNDSGDDY